jgi:hypothetical protein
MVVWEKFLAEGKCEYQLLLQPQSCQTDDLEHQKFLTLNVG